MNDIHKVILINPIAPFVSLEGRCEQLYSYVPPEDTVGGIE